MFLRRNGVRMASLFVFCGVVLVLSGCSTTSASTGAASSPATPTSSPTVTASASPTKAPGLYVTVSVSASSAKIGQPIPATLHIDNTTGHPIQVDSGMCGDWFQLGLVNTGHPTFPNEGNIGPAVLCAGDAIGLGQTSVATTIDTYVDTRMTTNPSYTPGVYTTLALKAAGATIHEANIIFSKPIPITLHD